MHISEMMFILFSLNFTNMYHNDFIINYEVNIRIRLLWMPFLVEVELVVAGWT